KKICHVNRIFSEINFNQQDKNSEILRRHPVGACAFIRRFLSIYNALTDIFVTVYFDRLGNITLFVLMYLEQKRQLFLMICYEKTLESNASPKPSQSELSSLWLRRIASRHCGMKG
ncbi:MAG: hypothetical protein AAGJ55_11970, partial [Cyanobacteria bacterium J06555_12]